jgi:DNA processing protein
VSTALAESAALVVLLRAAKRPWREYAELVESRGSALAVLEDEDSDALFRDDHAARLAEAGADIERWSADGIQLVTVLDPGYPENLRAVHDRPPLIFIAGRLAPADDRAVAVVGTRRPTQAGLATATEISQHLVDRGFTVASGLAAGIDTAAHTAALASHGRTVAVIGTGLNRCYPPANADLQRRLARESAVISQFWPEAPPTRRTFPMRNAVMSGLALATVVVEASEKSGSRMQARLALAHGRPVFLHQRLLEQHWARQFATRPGAHVFRASDEITEKLARLTDANTLVA